MPRARGLLLMGDNGGGWHLEASGLEHLEDGRCYQLWFVPDEPGAEPVSGGTFLACDRGTAQMGAPRIPVRPRAVFVTLEAEGGAEAIDNPRFVSARRARFMADDEPVLGVYHQGEARAYSLWDLDRHEIGNDTIAGSAIAVTW